MVWLTRFFNLHLYIFRSINVEWILWVFLNWRSRTAVVPSNVHINLCKFRLTLIAVGLYIVWWMKHGANLNRNIKASANVIWMNEWKWLFYSWCMHTGAQYILSESLFKTDKNGFYYITRHPDCICFLLLVYGMNTFYTCVHAYAFFFLKLPNSLKRVSFLFVCGFGWWM